jgi:hypothetical protein
MNVQWWREANSQNGIGEMKSPKFRLVHMVLEKPNHQNLGWGATVSCVGKLHWELRESTCLHNACWITQIKYCGGGSCGNSILNNLILNKYFSRDTFYIKKLFEKCVSDTHYIKHVCKYSWAHIIYIMADYVKCVSQISMTSREWIFCSQDSVRNPPTLIMFENWDSQLSACVITFSCHTGEFVN